QSMALALRHPSRRNSRSNFVKGTLRSASARQEFLDFVPQRFSPGRSLTQKGALLLNRPRHCGLEKFVNFPPPPWSHKCLVSSLRTRRQLTPSNWLCLVHFATRHAPVASRASPFRAKWRELRPSPPPSGRRRNA